jgi:hypothetical protein
MCPCIKGVKMGMLPSVPMVYPGVFIEGDAGGEPPLLSEAWALTNGLRAISGRCIAMDSVHGVSRLAAAFALRRASIACLCSPVILCRCALRCTLMASVFSVVRFCLLSLRRAFSCCRSVVVNTRLLARLRALSSCLSSRVRLRRWALWRSRDACRLLARISPTQK